MRELVRSRISAAKKTVFYSREGGNCQNQSFPGDYDVEMFTPTLLHLWRKDDPAASPWLMYLFWFVASAARYRIIYVRRDGAIVHVSHVLTRNPRLSFMERSDIHVGPCHTIPEFRGLGLFPATLAWITERYPERRIWMIANADNVASLRGMVKAGFRYAGCGNKRGGRYRISSDQAA